MIQRIKTFFKEVNGSIWFYLSLFIASLFFLRFTFFVHPDTSGDFWGNVRVEFVGFCFDVLLLGLIFSIFMQRYQRKQDIKRWQEEIDDYRGWNEKEATFRIVGNIRRLNRAKAKNIDLRRCYLNEAKLKRIHLEGANLHGAELINANFQEAHLEGANLSNTKLEGADFHGAHLEGANLHGTNLRNAVLVETSLDEAIVCNFPYRKDWLEKLKDLDVEGSEELIVKYYVAVERGRCVLKRNP